MEASPISLVLTFVLTSWNWNDERGMVWFEHVFMILVVFLLCCNWSDGEQLTLVLVFMLCSLGEDIRIVWFAHVFVILVVFLLFCNWSNEEQLTPPRR